MIELLHKNGNTYTVTPEAFEQIKLRHNWQATYTVVSSPDTPKEIVGKVKTTKKAEFEQDGFTTNDAFAPEQNAGQEQ